jgi:hypothetical protein
MINKTIIIILFILFFSYGLYAQDSDDEIMGWQDEFTLEGGLNWQKGTTKQLLFTYNLDYNTIYENEWDTALVISGNYGKTDNTLSENDHTLSINIMRLLFSARFAILYYGSIETDTIQNIYTRSTTGIGPRVWLLKNRYVHFSLYTFPIIEHTRTRDLLESEVLYREKNNANMIFFIDEDHSNSLALDYLYVPNLEDTSDYRTEFSVILTLAVESNLSISNTYKIEYTSKPLESELTEVEKKNYRNILSVTISF